MSALAAFVLGVLVGMTVLWLIFSVYWQRWRGYLTRDMAHLQAKVKSIEATNIGLERQLNTQKSDLAGMRSKVNTLETENRLAQARIDGAEAEKHSLSEHLSTLRGELATYKARAADREQSPAQARSLIPVNGNGKGNGAGHAGKQPEKKVDLFPAAGSNGHAHAGQDLPTLPLPGSAPSFGRKGEDDRLAETALSGLLRDLMETPVNGAAAKNGSAGKKVGQTNGKSAQPLNLDQFVEPEIVIARPRMGGDRLEIIHGVGPAVLKKLDQAGIDSFRVLAALTPERLKEVVGPRLARLIDEQNIIDQARKIIGEA